MVSTESPDAIPVDQVEIVPGEPLPVLVLPEGVFKIFVEDAGGKPLEVFTAEVAEPPSSAPPSSEPSVDEAESVEN